MYSRASVSRKFDEHCWETKRASEKDVSPNPPSGTLAMRVYGKGRSLAGALVVNKSDAWGVVPASCRLPPGRWADDQRGRSDQAGTTPRNAHRQQ
jgi:hypothetical protein